MFEYKIHTQRDKTFSGAFDPTEFEAALNAHAADGCRLAERFMVSSLWKSMKSEIVLILERPSIPPAQRHEPDTNRATPLNHRGVTCCTDHADRRDEASRYRPPNIPQRLNGRRATDRRIGRGDLPHNARPRRYGSRITERRLEAAPGHRR